MRTLRIINIAQKDKRLKLSKILIESGVSSVTLQGADSQDAATGGSAMLFESAINNTTQAGFISICFLWQLSYNRLQSIQRHESMP